MAHNQVNEIDELLKDLKVRTKAKMCDVMIYFAVRL